MKLWVITHTIHIDIKDVSLDLIDCPPANSALNQDSIFSRSNIVKSQFTGPLVGKVISYF